MALVSPTRAPSRADSWSLKSAQPRGGGWSGKLGSCKVSICMVLFGAPLLFAAIVQTHH
jgi:hypothetical protein